MPAFLYIWEASFSALSNNVSLEILKNKEKQTNQKILKGWQRTFHFSIYWMALLRKLNLLIIPGTQTLNEPRFELLPMQARMQTLGSRPSPEQEGSNQHTHSYSLELLGTRQTWAQTAPELAHCFLPSWYQSIHSASGVINRGLRQMALTQPSTINLSKSSLCTSSQSKQHLLLQEVQGSEKEE